MIVYDCAQGSKEWRDLRAGRPTASNFHRIMSPTRLQPSKQRGIYLLELVDEWLTGVKEDTFESEWTQRGRRLEGLARFAYEMEQGLPVRQVGFIARDDGLVGGSPDGLVLDEIVLEIKVPSPQRLNDNPARHMGQCQGLMYLAGRPLTHLWKYNDQGDSILTEIPRDDDWIWAFMPVLDEFLEELEYEKAKHLHAKVVA